jgi:GAF domain-containing protein
MNNTNIFETAFEKGKNPVPPDLRQKVCVQLLAKIRRLNRNGLNLQEFIEQVVNLIRNELGFYFVRLFLLRDDGYRKTAVMCAGSGEIGPLLIERRHGFASIAPPFVGVIDTAIGSNVVIIGDPFTDGFMVSVLPEGTDLEPIQPLQFREEIKGVTPDPLLPDTRIQMTIPLRTKEGVIGALCIYSCIPDSLSQQDIPIFLPLADCIAQFCSKSLD